MATARDFYDVLGVTSDAGSEEIQRAYRRLVRRYHPDVSPDPAPAERFNEIATAYEVLSDPYRRARYDRARSDRRDDRDRSDRPRRGRGATGLGGRSADPSRYPGHLDIGRLLGDLGIFGAGSAPGTDVEVEIDVRVDEAYTGGRCRVTVDTATGTRQYDVTIPAGVTDGERLRLPGQGRAGLGGGRRGDLYLVVRLAPDPRYRVDGRDVTTGLRLSPWEAALGATVPVETPAGPVRVDVPPGSSSGRRIRVRGRGLPAPLGTPGDLYAEVTIVTPAELTAAERELFARLAEVSTFDPRTG